VRSWALGPMTDSRSGVRTGSCSSRSPTSTAAAVRDAVRPRVAVVSRGRWKPFGHPASESLAALGARGVRVYRTDIASDVRVELLPNATRLRLRAVR
jgi:beta-lactamase superfamily II metal-dependent hydrolase